MVIDTVGGRVRRASPGVSQRNRSLPTISARTAPNMPQALQQHFEVGLANGSSPEAASESMLHVAAKIRSGRQHHVRDIIAMLETLMNADQP